MPDLATIAVFLTTSFFLLVVPGPTIALIVSKSVAQGRGIALPMVLGIAGGGALAAGLALAGVSVILMTSAIAFNLLKTLGAVYLFYLGVKLILSKPQAFSSSHQNVTETAYRSFRDGFLVMLFNPKGIVFFAAFVPQFIDPGFAYVPQAGILIGLFVLTGALVDTAYALLASKMGEAMNSPRLQLGVSKVAGIAIIGAGFATLLAKRPQV